MEYPLNDKWWMTPVCFGYNERESFRSGITICTYWALADTLLSIGLDYSTAWSIDEILL